jgi:hypothetical protein
MPQQKSSGEMVEVSLTAGFKGSSSSKMRSYLVLLARQAWGGEKGGWPDGWMAGWLDAMEK